MSWKRWTATSITLWLAISSGCSRDSPTKLIPTTQSGTGSGAGSAGDSAAKEYYLSKVDSQLDGTCATCHASGQNGAPTFMGSNASASYHALDQHGLVVAPDNSSLLLHGAHTGPALTASEKASVSMWLTMEAKERGLSVGSGSTGTTLKQALDEYGACMDINDWKASGLDSLYSAQTLNYGPCGSCHQAGEGGNWLGSNTLETFDRNREFPYIKRQITGTVDDDGNFKDLIAAHRFSQKGAEPCQVDTNCHPGYVLSPDLKAGIDAFVQKTLDKWHAKQCPPPP
jgi:mono/diheme cytochrome c family protein